MQRIGRDSTPTLLLQAGSSMNSKVGRERQRQSLSRFSCLVVSFRDFRGGTGIGRPGAYVPIRKRVHNSTPLLFDSLADVTDDETMDGSVPSSRQYHVLSVNAPGKKGEWARLYIWCWLQ